MADFCNDGSMEIPETTTPRIQRPEQSAPVESPSLPERREAPAPEELAAPRPVLLYGESFHHPNVFYRTGFLAPDPVVVIDEGPGKVTLWVNGMEYERARKEANVASVRSFSDLSPRVRELVKQAATPEERNAVLIKAVLEAQGITKVDVDDEFPAVISDGLRAYGIDVRPRLGIYQQQRRIKTQSEMLAIKATQDAGMDALQRAIDVIKKAEIKDGLLYRDGKPLTGDDLVSVVEQRLLELGCSTDDSICCGGPDSSDPHKATSPVLRVGLPIVLDIFPFHKKNRFWGDMTRTVVRGTPPAEVMAMWNAVKEAQEAGLKAVKAGVNAKDIHIAVCEALRKRGYGSSTPGYDDIKSTARFIHGTGHGVGLEIHEEPHVGGSDVVLKEGDIITVEPGLYDPQFGGIRIEDLIVVTKDGFVQLTTLPKIFQLDAEPGTARNAAEAP